MAGFPKPTRWKPSNPHKYVGDANNIIMRSSWERKFARWADSNPSVLKWGSEIHPIPYMSSVDGKAHRYFPDFFVQMHAADGTVKHLIIEIKPHAQTRVPAKPKRRTSKTEYRYLEECKTFVTNQCKWKAATEFADANGWQFVVLDEYDLGISKKK